MWRKCHNVQDALQKKFEILAAAGKHDPPPTLGSALRCDGEGALHLFRMHLLHLTFCDRFVDML